MEKAETAVRQQCNFRFVTLYINIFSCWMTYNQNLAELYLGFLLGGKHFHNSQDWYFVTKIVLTYCEKKLF